MSGIGIDGILVTAFVSILVGFVTAILSIVRLVNDKESKTTEYRQGWTDSLRECIADLVSDINSIAGEIVRKSELQCEVVDCKNEDEKKALNLMISEYEKHIRELRRGMYKSYSLARLHFKPNDNEFIPIEHKFDVVVETIHNLERAANDLRTADGRIGGAEMAAKSNYYKYDSRNLIGLKEKIHAEAAEITGYSRFILKNTWETVKKGERAYESTKKWSIRGGAAAFVVLVIFGAASIYNVWNHSGERVQKILPDGRVDPDFSGGKSGGLRKEKLLDDVLGKNLVGRGISDGCGGGNQHQEVSLVVVDGVPLKAAKKEGLKSGSNAVVSCPEK